MNAQLMGLEDQLDAPLDSNVQWGRMAVPLPTYNHLRAERDRLNRRLAVIRSTEYSTAMARYRRFVGKASEAEKRGVPMALVIEDDRRFMEPVDLVELLHAKLDEMRVPPMHQPKACFP